jgi:hypothetical protein
MDLSEALSISFKVLADWRVDFIALAVIVAWAALRYVGSVYRRRSKTRSRPAHFVPGAPASGAAPGAGGRPAARPGRAEKAGNDSDTGMVE